jgi:putative transcriptional regulator
MTGKNGRKSLFERVKAGLEEGIRYCRGEVELKVTELLARPPELEKGDVIALRQRLQMTPQAFARLLNVPVATVKLWETGKRKPSRAALRLMQICVEQPEVPEKLVQATVVRPIKRRLEKSTSK